MAGTEAGGEDGEGAPREVERAIVVAEVAVAGRDEQEALRHLGIVVSEHSAAHRQDLLVERQRLARSPFGLQCGGEVVPRRDHAIVRLAELRLEDGERAPEEGLRRSLVPPRLYDHREIVESEAEIRVICAQDPLLPLGDAPQQCLRRNLLTFLTHDLAEAGQIEEEVGILLSGERPFDREALPVGLLGWAVLAAILRQASEVDQALAHRPGAGAFRTAGDGERFAVTRLGLGAAARRAERHPELVERLRHPEVAVAHRPALDREGLAEERLGAPEIRALVAGGRDVLEALGELERSGTRLGAAKGERPLEERLGVLRSSEAEIDPSKSVHQARLEIRLTGELRRDPTRALIEDGARVERLVLPPVRIRPVEYADQESESEARLVALPREAPSLGEQADQQAEDDECGDEPRRDAGGVTAHELPRAVEDGVGPRDDRQVGEMSREIVRQLIDRAVATRRILAERFQDDGVEVATELTGEGARAGRAGAGDRLRRFVAGRVAWRGLSREEPPLALGPPGPPAARARRRTRRPEGGTRRCFPRPPRS